MKKNIICFTMLLFSAASFCQQTTTATPTLTKTDYLQKSKKQSSNARVLLGSGGAIVLIGIILTAEELPLLKPTCIISGALAMLTSIPFFIASLKNKKKGMSLSLKNETSYKLYKESIVSIPIPSLYLKISL